MHSEEIPISGQSYFKYLFIHLFPPISFWREFQTVYHSKFKDFSVCLVEVISECNSHDVSGHQWAFLHLPSVSPFFPLSAPVLPDTRCSIDDQSLRSHFLSVLGLISAVTADHWNFFLSSSPFSPGFQNSCYPDFEKIEKCYSQDKCILCIFL